MGLQSGVPEMYSAHFQLLANETLDYFLEGDGFFLGTDIVSKIMAKWQSFVTMITGGHIKIGFILTNLRLVIVESRAACCGFTANRVVHTIALKSIAEAKTLLETQCCCIKTKLVSIESRSFKYNFAVKRFDELQLQDFITRMSLLIQRNAG